MPANAFILLAVFAADPGYPYEAYVVADQAEIVAGPGHRFYITDKLLRGTAVEIYREEPSGWLAIRPPEGSFSWIPADFVELLEEGIGKVKEPTGAWVGTTVEHVSEHHEQLRLKPGELVSIMGEKTTATKTGGQQTWFKIAPPAGEFRWIHLRDVSRQKPAEDSPPEIRQIAAQEEPVQEADVGFKQPPRRLDLHGQAIALEAIQDRPARRDFHVEPAQFRQAITPDSRPLSPDGFVPRRRRDAESAAMPTTSSTAAAMVNSSPRVASVSPPRAASVDSAITTSASTGPIDPDVRRQLDQIELDLSLMLAQEQSAWDFTSIERRVQALVDGGGDPVSRGRARLVLEKIRQFEKSLVASKANPRSASQPSAPTPAVGTNTLADPRYDAQGTLKEVISRKSARPAAPYAVVDADGQPVCFVSPSPGLNLNRYLNKQVGLYGRRGYLEELKKPHVVAERVIEVERR